LTLGEEAADRARVERPWRTTTTTTSRLRSTTTTTPNGVAVSHRDETPTTAGAGDD
jgi:hypothetical protein